MENSTRASKLRRVIAEKLTTSWNTMPRVAYTKIAVCDRLKQYRTKLNNGREKPDQISFNVLIAYAAVKCLKKYPEVNGRFENDRIITNDSINLGIAVDAPRGLIVPNVKEAQSLTLDAFARKANVLVNAARDGILSLEDIQEGTFTVSNMGMLGIDHATPIINYPESSILGVYSMREVPAAVDGELVIQTQQNLVLVADHRMVDGALAAKFLCDTVYAIEHPDEVFV